MQSTQLSVHRVVPELPALPPPAALQVCASLADVSAGPGTLQQGSAKGTAGTAR